MLQKVDRHWKYDGGVVFSRNTAQGLEVPQLKYGTLRIVLMKNISTDLES